MSNNTLGGVTRASAPIGQNTLGLRGGNGTSQPHLAMAPMIPTMIPIKMDKPT